MEKTQLLAVSASLAAVMLTQSCSDKYIITGNSLESLYDGKVAYLHQTDNDVFRVVDSCRIVHGKFTMSGVLDSARCVTLDMGGFTLPLVLEQGEILVSSANSVINVTGTPLNDRLYAFLKTRDSLMTVLNYDLPRYESSLILEGVGEDEIALQIGSEIANVRQTIDKLETGFIVDNFDNVLGTAWFLELCNDAYQHFGYPTTTPQIDEIYSRAPESFRVNPDVAKYMKMCSE